MPGGGLGKGPPFPAAGPSSQDSGSGLIMLLGSGLQQMNPDSSELLHVSPDWRHQQTLVGGCLELIIPQKQQAHFLSPGQLPTPDCRPGS